MLKGFAQKKNELQQSLGKSRQEQMMSSAEELAGIADSLDLENSDDLNKIIQKYETMLGGSASKDQGHSKAPTPLPQMLQTKSSKV